VTDSIESRSGDLVGVVDGHLGRDLARRLVAEALGTALLIIAVVGSGIMATTLSPTDVGLQLLENAAATAGALVGLILMFGAVSGAHFNPVVTLVDRMFGSISTRHAGLYVVAQTFGGCVGAVVANVMFSRPAFELSTTTRSSGALWLSEVVATIGLLLVIHGCIRSGRASVVPFAVGLWIGGAYFFTSSTSFANPAVTIARMLSDSFAGIKPSSAPMFVLMQLVGAVMAFGVIRFLYPFNADDAERRPTGAAASVVPRSNPDSQVDAQPHVPGVLFMCVHNAGRSQMAAGWLRHLAGDRVQVWSGGSAPAAEINPSAVAAMAEVGIDITTEFPKPWTDAVVRTADVVVSMGCGDVCPVYPGKRYVDWDLEDPADQGVDAVRPIRDEIRTRVEALMASLGVSAN
jgi:arsenate reductase (thioredoxin)